MTGEFQHQGAGLSAGEIIRALEAGTISVAEADRRLQQLSVSELGAYVSENEADADVIARSAEAFAGSVAASRTAHVERKAAERKAAEQKAAALGQAKTAALKVLHGVEGQRVVCDDPLGDMIARINNAAARKRSKVTTPASKLRGRVLDVLQGEGYISGYSLVAAPGKHPEFEIELKYFDGDPVVVVEIMRVSKPGRRVYSSLKDLKPVKNGLGISILATPKGVMSDTSSRDADGSSEVVLRLR